MARRVRPVRRCAVSIRLRCPNVTLSRYVVVTVVESAVGLVREGDHVEFRTDEDRSPMGHLRVHGHEYRIGNVHFIPDVADERHTLVECELADER